MSEAFIVFIASAVAVMGWLGFARWLRHRRRPARVTRKYGVRAWFGCGHESPRGADIELLDGSERFRAFPRPEAGAFNCHDCYVRTGEEKPVRPVS